MTSPTQEAGEAIKRLRSEIAATLVGREFARNPGLEQRYGAIGREKSLQDAGYHLDFLSQALALESPPLFTDYVAWAKVMLAQRRVLASDLAFHLKCLAEVVTADALPRGKGETILLVDDEVSILDITRQTLEAFGYRVIVAEDGAQAIGQYALHRPEIALVLTDMMMPVMDGPALIAALRRVNPAVRIIAASGLSAAGQAGVKYHLAKPYTAEAMLQTIRRALRDEPGSGFPTVGGG